MRESFRENYIKLYSKNYEDRHLKMSINKTLQLPCGVEIKNRFLKSAMTEGIANSDALANNRHVNLYERWAKGGTGISVTGNVQIDHRYIERAGNVVIEGTQTNKSLAALANWSQAGKQNNTQLWMQLSHAGRQTPFSINKKSVAPSVKPMPTLGGVLKFGVPEKLSHSQILDVIDRFIHAAEVAKQTGFTGVQLHSAHGYLLSEFLSPNINNRTDQWGGSIENRSRLLISIIDGIRAKVGNSFPISVKINSSDFQKGGFTHEESIEVVKLLNLTSLDLLELSGGTYENFAALEIDSLNLKKFKVTKPQRSTVVREAYFLKYAEEIKKFLSIPLAVTGGFRTANGMNSALNSGACDVIGLGRPLCSEPEIINELISGERKSATLYENILQFGPWIFGLNSPFALMRSNNKVAQVYWCYRQILKMADGEEANNKLSLTKALFDHLREDSANSKKYKKYWSDLN